MAVPSPCGQTCGWADAATRGTVSITVSEYETLEMNPIFSRKPFPPSSLTLYNSLTCQSCFTRRLQGWIFEAKAGDEQSPPVYRPPGLYWAADGTRRPSAYCTYLSSLDRTSEPTLPPARINVNGLARRRHGGGREREAVTQRRASLNSILCRRVLNYNER